MILAYSECLESFSFRVSNVWSRRFWNFYARDTEHSIGRIFFYFDVSVEHLDNFAIVHVSNVEHLVRIILEFLHMEC